MTTPLSIVLLVACITLQAQTPSITLNDAELRVGMSKDEALRKLKINNKAVLHQMHSQQARSQSPSSDEVWCLKWISDKSTDFCSAIGGTVGFSAGRLYTARKDLYDVRDEESAAGLVSKLFASLAELKASGQKMVEFETIESPVFEGGREIRVRGLIFILKETKLVLTVNQGLGGFAGSSVIASEEIREVVKR